MSQRERALPLKSPPDDFAFPYLTSDSRYVGPPLQLDLDLFVVVTTPRPQRARVVHVGAIHGACEHDDCAQLPSMAVACIYDRVGRVVFGEGPKDIDVRPICGQYRAQFVLEGRSAPMIARSRGFARQWGELFNARMRKQRPLIAPQFLDILETIEHADLSIRHDGAARICNRCAGSLASRWVDMEIARLVRCARACGIDVPDVVESASMLEDLAHSIRRSRQGCAESLAHGAL